MIGEVESECDPLVVTQTGKYQHDQLSKLIESSGANIFFFPSIWPETFSYVVQELITMKLPTASFKLGAPAERLEIYPKGLLIESMNPVDILDELISFHQKIYH